MEAAGWLSGSGIGAFLLCIRWWCKQERHKPEGTVDHMEIINSIEKYEKNSS